MFQIHQLSILALLAFLVYCFCAASPTVSAKTVNVVLVAGQSNASGRATVADLPSNPFDAHVDFFYDTDITGASTRVNSAGQFVQLTPPGSTFGPEMALGRILSQKKIADLAIVKVTRGGTNLRTDWEKGNTNGDQMYSLFIDTVTDAFDVLQDRGDIVNVLGMAWHQGESDAGNEANNPGNYQANLTQFISDVRTDLSLPQLPIMIGGVFEPGREELYAAQQATAEAVADTYFVSSSGTSVFDVTTHLDARSQLLMGTRFANALTPSAQYVEFEQPSFDVGLLAGQNGWVSNGLVENLVVPTQSSGSYIAGQAAGHVDSGGLESLGSFDIIPVYGRSMTADFFAGDATDHDQDGSSDYDDDGVADSSVRLYGWSEDTNGDGFFSEGSGDRRGLGFGLDNDGTIVLRTADDNTEISTGVAYDLDNWYQLTMTWTNPDSSGKRQVSLFADDLTNETPLNGGDPIFSATMSAEEFGGDPSTWIGTGIRATRGLVDNIHFSTDASAADFDLDGNVSQDDLQKWQQDFARNRHSDADGDGDSDGADFLSWQRASSSSLDQLVAAQIPEPSSILLAMLFACSLRRMISRPD